MVLESHVSPNEFPDSYAAEPRRINPRRVLYPKQTPPLIGVTEGNGTGHTCVSVPFPLLSLF